MDSHIRDKEQIMEQLKGSIKLNQAKLLQSEEEAKHKKLLEQKKNDLLKALDEEFDDIERVIADKEKEKVIETHELNENITKKIEETKSSLETLKKEQLDTTRRFSNLLIVD